MCSVMQLERSTFYGLAVKTGSIALQKFFLKHYFFLKNATPRGETPPPHTHIGDISDNYERILTHFSAISLLTRLMSINRKNIEICNPLLGQPTPHILI